MENIEQFFIKKLNVPDAPKEFLDNTKIFNELMMEYSCAIKEVCTKLENLNAEFQLKHRHNPIQSISHRVKSPISIINKVEKKFNDFNVHLIKENLDDVAGVRVICSYINDIYEIARLLTQQDDVKLIETKDYIKNPKPSGYRSFHLIIEVPVFLSSGKVLTRVEIQIRTIAMDFWASLEHQLMYKVDVSVPEEIRDQLRECAVTIAGTDETMQNIQQKIQLLEDK